MRARGGAVTKLRRRLTLPSYWATVRGLWLCIDGLRGAVLDESADRIVLFEGARTIAIDAYGWSVREVIACLAGYDVPLITEPTVAPLTERDLQPLLACGALTQVDRLLIMSHVPGWRPDAPTSGESSQE